jgi:hypothetical protein
MISKPCKVSTNLEYVPRMRSNSCHAALEVFRIGVFLFLWFY